jgi:hypothetical protein
MVILSTSKNNGKIGDVPYKNPADPASVEKARASRRKHYHANKQPYLDRAREAKEERRRYLDDLKGKTPCMDCGIQYPHYVMEFDHREGEEKISTVGHASSSWKAIHAEIAKCDIVCANCHSIRTHLRRVSGGRASVSKNEMLGSNP